MNKNKRSLFSELFMKNKKFNLIKFFFFLSFFSFIILSNMGLNFKDNFIQLFAKLIATNLGN
jgi:hypothetical protein